MSQSLFKRYTQSILISLLKEIELSLFLMDSSFYLVEVLTCIVTRRGLLFHNSVQITQPKTSITSHLYISDEIPAAMQREVASGVKLQTSFSLCLLSVLFISLIANVAAWSPCQLYQNVFWNISDLKEKRKKKLECFWTFF